MKPNKKILLRKTHKAEFYRFMLKRLNYNLLLAFYQMHNSAYWFDNIEDEEKRVSILDHMYEARTDLMIGYSVSGPLTRFCLEQLMRIEGWSTELQIKDGIH